MGGSGYVLDRTTAVAYTVVTHTQNDRCSAAVMLTGGTAGVAAWLSVYPLDVVKARLQAMSAAQAQHAGEHL